jgi:hypothetical protein
VALLTLPTGAASAQQEFRAQFRLTLRADEATAAAAIRVVQTGGALKALRLDMPAEAFTAVTGDGKLRRSGDHVSWEVPARGGELRYRVTVTHSRRGGGYDALVTRDWALFRADDAFSPAAATLRPGARGRSELVLDLPPGWSAQTQYPPDAAGRLAVVGNERRYARPAGWILAGRIGSRMDVIGATTVRVAGPRGEPVPRVPMLALLRWTLPVFQAELDTVPPYLLVVAAGDPMWRGGLSAPASLYLHASRPLISENGTSPLLHEVAHVVAPVPAAPEHDWIDEGIAEYLALRVLRSSGTISQERFRDAIETFRRRGAGVNDMLTRSSSGEITARAVAAFSDVDEELSRLTGGKADIFDLVRRMGREERDVDLARLRELAGEITDGRSLAALSPRNVPTRP